MCVAVPTAAAFIYTARLSPALNGNSEMQRFECRDAIFDVDKGYFTGLSIHTSSKLGGKKHCCGEMHTCTFTYRIAG